MMGYQIINNHNGSYGLLTDDPPERILSPDYIKQADGVAVGDFLIHDAEIYVMTIKGLIGGVYSAATEN